MIFNASQCVAIDLSRQFGSGKVLISRDCLEFINSLDFCLFYFCISTYLTLTFFFSFYSL